MARKSSKSKVSAVNPNTDLVGSPRYGRSLEGAVAPLRGAVIEAMGAIGEVPTSVASYLSELVTLDQTSPKDDERAKWFCTTLLLIDFLAHKNRVDPKRAISWFFHTSEIDFDEKSFEKSANIIGSIDPVVASPLLPYLLDPYGKTSRLDVIKNQSRKAQRTKRKATGSFYTPSDVADFMVKEIAGGGTGKPSLDERWFDPAVGSGVFLLAALRRFAEENTDEYHIREFATKHLFGADISAQACDFAALSILANTPDGNDNPSELFSVIRRNFCAIDSTVLQRKDGSAILNDLLPRDRPVRLICNPPYVKGEPTADADGRLVRSLYLPFVQMAWTIARENFDAAALVVPLAIGANRSSDHRRLRQDIARQNGDWSFLFFDRQPSALFGEDAKTRSTILIKKPATKSTLKTSRLLKWTSRQRLEIFTSNRAVPVDKIDIGRLVPKLGNEGEVDLYKALSAFRDHHQNRPSLSKALAHEIVGSELSTDVFIAGTAYNFLNVFRNYPDKLSANGPLSASGIHKLSTSDFERADEVTALLASRTAFWLWHVECDGFHVPAWFLDEHPLLGMPFSTESRGELSKIGREVWKGLTADVITSINAGRLTFAFRPSQIQQLRKEVDAVIFSALGLSKSSAKYLDEFEARTVSVDGSDRGSRKHSQWSNKK